MTLTDRIRDAENPYTDGTWDYPANVGVPCRVSWPWPRGVAGARVAKQVGERRIRCSTLTASILMRAYPAAPWTSEDYKDLQVQDATRPASPIDAVVRVGVGVRVEAFVAESWHLVQGWRDASITDGDGLDGHAFLVWSRGNGFLDVLESTSIDLDGPRWRKTTAGDLGKRYPAALLIARLLP